MKYHHTVYSTWWDKNANGYVSFDAVLCQVLTLLIILWTVSWLPIGFLLGFTWISGGCSLAVWWQYAVYWLCVGCIYMIHVYVACVFSALLPRDPSLAFLSHHGRSMCYSHNILEVNVSSNKINTSHIHEFFLMFMNMQYVY